MRAARLVWLTILFGVVTVFLAVVVGQNTAHAADVQIGITVRADRVDRDPITAIVKTKDTIKWTSKVVEAKEAAKIRITLTSVGSNPFVGGASYDSGTLDIGAAIPDSPAISKKAATATPNVYAYEIRVFKANNEEIVALRETRNFIWVPGKHDGKRRVRGLFVSGLASASASFDNDVNHLRDVIRFGTNWIALPAIGKNLTQAQLVDRITATATEADDNDIFVFLFSGHGSKLPDWGKKDKDYPKTAKFGNLGMDDPPEDSEKVTDTQGNQKNVCAMFPPEECDELIHAAQGTFIADDVLGDGTIGQAFAKVRGIKVLIFDTCYSGGLMDRTRSAASFDLPIPNSIVLTACNTNQFSYGTSTDFVFGHAHGYFSGSLISGLLNNVDPIGERERPIGNFVAADSPGTKPNSGPDHHVTVKEWFDFAGFYKVDSPAVMMGQVGWILRLKSLGGKEGNQIPEINDDFAAPGYKASDVVIFSYKGKNKNEHKHTDEPEVKEKSSTKCGECLPAPSGLVAWWPGDENVSDIQGTNNGTLQGGATFGDGKVGQAFSLDGVDDYVSIPHDNLLNPSAITVDAWFHASDISGQSIPPIVKKAGGGPGGQSFGYALEINNDLDGTVRFWVFISGIWYNASSTDRVSPDTWYHVAGTYDGSAIRLYLNGQLQGSTDVAGSFQPSSNPLFIGSDPVNPNRVFEGFIDEVEIFDRALDPSEIQAIYEADSAGKCRSDIVV